MPTPGQITSLSLGTAQPNHILSYSLAMPSADTSMCATSASPFAFRFR